MIRPECSDATAGPPEQRSTSEPTVQELAEAYFRDLRLNGRRHLIRAQRIWDTHLRPRFGNLHAGEITSQMMDAYIDRRLRKGASFGTVNRELAALDGCSPSHRSSGRRRWSAYPTSRT